MLPTGHRVDAGAVQAPVVNCGHARMATGTRDTAVRSTLLSLAAVVALVYVLLCAYLWLMQRSMMYFPTPPADAGPAESLSIRSGGDALRVWRLNPGRAEAILYFGGNAEDVALNLPEFDDWFPACTVYLFNYRGYGGSEGAPSEHALYEDARSVYDRANEEHERIFVIGRSLGAGVATRLATERTVSRLALVTPPASFTRLVAELYPIFPTGLLLRDRYDSLARAGYIESQVLVLIAERDEIIPPDHSRALAAAIDPERVTTELIEGAGHNTIGASPAYGRALRSFLCDTRV
jgi:pimeloyl-ACP methyl ester carboxylesterase